MLVMLLIASNTKYLTDEPTVLGTLIWVILIKEPQPVLPSTHTHTHTHVVVQTVDFGHCGIPIGGGGVET